jgi:hypothetical protein
MKPNSEEFFNKYGFTLSITKKHPKYEDQMSFEGLEADYVSWLERELNHYKEVCDQVMASNERLLTRESYRLHDEIKKLKMKEEK